MRVIIDGRALQGGSSVRGIGTYTRGLLSGIAELGRLADIAVLLQIGPSPPELQQVTIDAVARRVAVVQPTLQRMLDPILVARALRDERADVFHSVDLVQPWRATMPAVVTVHDLIPFRFPQWYRWARRSRLPALRRLRHAQRIIAVSHATARDVSYFAGVDPDAITVVPEGVSPRFTRAGDSEIASVCATYGVKQPYLLAVGTFDPRKRIRMLAAMAASVRRQADVQLVIAGAQMKFQPHVEGAVRDAGIANATRLLGHVGAGELRSLYSGAACLVFTSAYEGFGLPLLEAMACATPVVACDNSSVPEVCGDAALLVPDGDASVMAAAVLSLIDIRGTREEMARRSVAHAARFTWKSTADQTLAVYQGLLA